MDLQEIITYIIISVAVIYSIYNFVNNLRNKTKNSDMCKGCPYSTKNGTCSRK